MVLVTLGGCYLLDGLVACDSVEVHKVIVWCSEEEIVRGTVLTPWGSQRATLLERDAKGNYNTPKFLILDCYLKTLN